MSDFERTRIDQTTAAIHEILPVASTDLAVALIDEGKILVHDSLSQLLLDHGEEGLEGLFINLTGKSYRDSDV